MTAVGVAVSRRRALRRPAFGAGTGLGAIVLLLIVVAAVHPSLLATADPDAVDPLSALAGPGAHHYFGTDQLGRDVYSRVVYGARPTLIIGLGATAIAVAAGSLLGVLAATGGRAADEIIMRITDVLLAFPGMLAALVVISALGPGTVNATIAIGFSLAPGFVRLGRGQVLTVRDSGYVAAAVVLGRRRTAIVFRHLLPNALSPLLILATLNVGTAIIAGSSLSFLGLGPRPPSPEWGAMLSQGRDYLGTAWAIAVFPGLAVTATVVAFNVVGRDIQRRFEGRRPDGRD